MKRQNFVVLNGILQRSRQVTEQVDGKQVAAMRALLVFDYEQYGGHHRVVFPGRLGMEVMAFAQAAKSNGLEVTIDGWLRSREDEAVVVADRAMFDAREAVRQEAATITRDLLARIPS